MAKEIHPVKLNQDSYEPGKGIETGTEVAFVDEVLKPGEQGDDSLSAGQPYVIGPYDNGEHLYHGIDDGIDH